MSKAKSIPGIDVRESSIRVKFTWQGKQVRERLSVNGVPLAPTMANIKYATRLVAEVKAQIAAGTFDYAATFPDSKAAPKAAGRTGDELFFDLIDRWWDTLELKPSTKTQYLQQKENFWKVHLANKPIKQFVHSDIKGALLKGTWKSNKSRNNQLSIIRGVFELAVLDKQIATNPCDGLEHATVQEKAPDPFSLKEVAQVLAGLRKWYSEQIVNYVQFQFFSGLRTSEAIALAWDDVDFNAGEVLVHEVVVYKEAQDSTKTNMARKVKLTSEAKAAIERQKKFTRVAGGKVFNDPYYNEPWLYQRITNSAFWKTTLRRLGMRHRRAYNTRHTYATLGLMAGANPAFMARQLGHSVEMFFKVYAKWIDGLSDEREIAKIERAIAEFTASGDSDKEAA